MSRMPQRLRKLVLTAHVVVSVGWVGLDAALILLGITGLFTSDPEVLRAAYVAAGLLGAVFIIPVAVGALVTGILLSVGTPWGLLRHYWVLAKFVLTVALTAAAILVLRQRLTEAAARVSDVPTGTLTGADVGAVGVQLVIAPSVALVVLITATVLSVYKPRGKTRFARRKKAIERGGVKK